MPIPRTASRQVSAALLRSLGLGVPLHHDVVDVGLRWWGQGWVSTGQQYPCLPSGPRQPTAACCLAHTHASPTAHLQRHADVLALLGLKLEDVQHTRHPHLEEHRLRAEVGKRGRAG